MPCSGCSNGGSKVQPVMRITRSSTRSSAYLTNFQSLNTPNLPYKNKSELKVGNSPHTETSYIEDDQIDNKDKSFVSRINHSYESSESVLRKCGRSLKHISKELVHLSQDASKDTLNDSSKISPECSDHGSKRSRMDFPISDSSTDSSLSKSQRQLRPRSLPFRFYSISRAYSSLKANHERKCDMSNRTRQSRLSLRRRRHRILMHNFPTEESINVDEQHNNEILGDEEVGENNEKETRRYPVRNRRHTDVYQVDNLSNHHHSHPHRNWLAGTGCESRRSQNHKTRHHVNFRRYGSTTSPSTSSSDNSGSELPPPFTNPNRTHYLSKWNHLYSTGLENNKPFTVDKDEERFERRRIKSIMHSRSELMPININDVEKKSTLNERLVSGTNLADIEPMSVDTSIGFDRVSGHDHHILSLKESVILPLMYPEVFAKFNIDPPRGVLFSGPPGTGKTLLARALANECSRIAQSTRSTTTTNSSSSGGGGGNNNTKQTNQRPTISFFMRKGADCLSKWVGESERQLRLLFDQAYRMRPSIIFFDEIDGLAPVRSSRQDQIHSSIVSTLLSLMDGVDNRAEVVVIGATNRPDSIDPALRRPGRFDREFVFDLPTELVRGQILAVMTSTWDPKPESTLLDKLAEATYNFSGADLKALTTEACLSCLRRCYPQVYQSQVKLILDSKYLEVMQCDWLKALQLVRASSDRSNPDAAGSNLTPAANALASTTRTPLASNLCIFQHIVDKIVKHLSYTLLASNKNVPMFYPHMCGDLVLKSKFIISEPIPECLMQAVWHRLETVQVYTLNLANLFAFPSSVGMCPEAAVAQIISTIRSFLNAPSLKMIHGNPNCSSPDGIIIYLPGVDRLFDYLNQLTVAYLIDQLNNLLKEVNNHFSHILPPCQRDKDYCSDNSNWTCQIFKSPRRALLLATCTKQKILKDFTKQWGILDKISCYPNKSPPSSIHKNVNLQRNATHNTSPDVSNTALTLNGISSNDESNLPIHMSNNIDHSHPRHHHNHSKHRTPMSSIHPTTNDEMVHYSYYPDLQSIKLELNLYLPNNSSTTTTSTTTTTTNSSSSSSFGTKISPITHYLSKKIVTTSPSDMDKELDAPYTSSQDRLIIEYMTKLFDSNQSKLIVLSPPTKEERFVYFSNVLKHWPQLMTNESDDKLVIPNRKM